MSGRRIHLRSHGSSAEGTLRVCQGVTIEPGMDGTGLAVLSDSFVPVGEELTLFLVGGDGGQLEVRARVGATQPHVVNGSLRHRLRLSIVSAPPSLERGHSNEPE